MIVKQDSNLVLSRNMKAKQDSNLALSRKMKVKQDSDLVLSRNRSFELLNRSFELLNMKKIDRITELIISEFELHPKAQLIDYYKLFFQGTFGPGHIIKDKISAENNLKTELTNTSNFEDIEFQNISFLNTFYRVNINVLNEEIISLDDFLDAFLKSANIENEINHNEWMENWKNIEKQFFKLKIPIENIEQQSAELWEIIKDKQLVSHSNAYRAAYSPHYRLISSAQFQRLGLNLFERRKIYV